MAGRRVSGRRRGRVRPGSLPARPCRSCCRIMAKVKQNRSNRYRNIASISKPRPVHCLSYDVMALGPGPEPGPRTPRALRDCTFERPEL